MDTDTARHIGAMRSQLESLHEGLPYADHGAYGQDLQRIRELEREIRQLGGIVHTHIPPKVSGARPAPERYAKRDTGRHKARSKIEALQMMASFFSPGGSTT